jgi:hypothetical protein
MEGFVRVGNERKEKKGKPCVVCLFKAFLILKIINLWVSKNIAIIPMRYCRAFV